MLMMQKTNRQMKTIYVNLTQINNQSFRMATKNAKQKAIALRRCAKKARIAANIVDLHLKKSSTLELTNDKHTDRQ